MLKPYIAKIMNRVDLSALEAEEAMMIIMSGTSSQAQIGAYLVSLRMKGETVDEIGGSARAMRAKAAKVFIDLPDITDTAGTGGDGSQSFNISTAAAFVIAGAGKSVAKHGNRAASSKCGSADVLQALGVSIDMAADKMVESVYLNGIGFFFAPLFHPAMKNVAGPRKEIGQRTIFNLLGPLCNPAGATTQIVGVFAPELTETLALVLRDLGIRSAMVVHGHGGMDELTTSGPNRVAHLKNGIVSTYLLDPSEYGLRPAGKDELRGGEAGSNAEIIYDILSNKDKSARRDVVVLNAAAALAAPTGDFASSLAQARDSLDSGAAHGKLEALVDFGRRSR